MPPRRRPQPDEVCQPLKPRVRADRMKSGISCEADGVGLAATTIGRREHQRRRVGGRVPDDASERASPHTSHQPGTVSTRELPTGRSRARRRPREQTSKPHRGAPSALALGGPAAVAPSAPVAALRIRGPVGARRLSGPVDQSAKPVGPRSSQKPVLPDPADAAEAPPATRRGLPTSEAAGARRSNEVGDQLRSRWSRVSCNDDR